MQRLALLLSLSVVLAFAASASAKPSAPVCPGPASPGTARCHAHVVTDKSGTAASSAAPAGYGPAQFHTAYGLPATTAVAQTIAIVDAYDDSTIRSDLTKYDSTYKIPDLPTCATPQSTGACFVKVNQNGQTSPLPSKNSGWALEIALDVETAHEICQNCKIVLVEATSNSGANLDAAEDAAFSLGATEISNSWGTTGEYSSELSENSAHFDHPGVAITVSSGDNGYNAFGFPAASNTVIAVGGTTLNLNSDNSWQSESTWSGAGSGCSVYFAPQSWQLTASGWGATGCSGRGVADVAADADPNTGAAVYDSTRYQGRTGWFQVGGTSLSSPLVAGVYALAGNASGYPASLAYANTGALHDVTTGPTTGNCGTTACAAGAGYDGPTGLGSPIGLGAF